MLLKYTLSNSSVPGIVLGRQQRYRHDARPLRGLRQTHRHKAKLVSCSQRPAQRGVSSQSTLANSRQGGKEGREEITSELNFKGKSILYIIVVTSQGMVKKTANTHLDNYPEHNLTIIPVAYGPPSLL